MIYFEDSGVAIYNPFISSCGRFEVDPRTYGFEEIPTGGGFVALAKTLPSGTMLMLTDETGMHAPTSEDGALIGAYDKNGEEFIVHNVPSAQEIEELMNKRFEATWGEGFAQPKVETVDLSFFSEDNCYSFADAYQISQLKPGESWQCPDHSTHHVRLCGETESSDE